MNRPSILDYVKATLFVAGINIAAVALFFSLTPCLACVCDSDRSNLIATVGLMWLILILGFLQGRWFRQETIFVAVPIGTVLTWTPVLTSAFEIETSFSFALLFALVVPPALASLAARRGMLYKCGRQKQHLFWLIGMLSIFAVLPICVKWLDGWSHGWR